MTIGELIKTEREQCGLTQEQLSEKSGVSSRSISHYENDERDPQMMTLGKIMGAMGIQIKFERMEEMK
ncbi:helix-turn-helix domain-containing protein [Acetobacterium sp.]|uniref:helix-turn-helix domain-containing protein n=1 Tax=Acetobacterium sp. TaxID=1872094 RepID=UPI0027188585|nr:helix-turn-helix transcriptional regulator [Acetobacterium sp.]MDO9492829.1 helix-turn-helix transcriptional regulator [Acetobacterium sp.]